jgi:hypothetical protein
MSNMVHKPLAFIYPEAIIGYSPVISYVELFSSVISYILSGLKTYLTEKYAKLDVKKSKGHLVEP